MDSGGRETSVVLSPGNGRAFDGDRWSRPFVVTVSSGGLDRVWRSERLGTAVGLACGAIARHQPESVGLYWTDEFRDRVGRRRLAGTARLLAWRAEQIGAELSTGGPGDDPLGEE